MTDQTPNPEAPAAAPASADPSTFYTPSGTDSQAPAGADTTPAAAGADSVGADTSQGTPQGSDSQPGNDTLGGDSTPGSDSTPGELTLASYDAIKLPEGATPDDAILGQFKELALTAKLDPNAAQKLVDLNTKLLTAQQEAQQAEYTRIQADWQKATLALPDFIGSKREESLAIIGRMFDDYGTPDIREVLEVTGAGNHPAIAQLMLKLARAVGEGAPTQVGRPAVHKGPRSVVEVAGAMYETK